MRGWPRPVGGRTEAIDLMTEKQKLGIAGAIGALALAAVGVWFLSIGSEAQVFADMYIGFGISFFGMAAILGFLSFKEFLE